MSLRVALIAPRSNLPFDEGIAFGRKSTALAMTELIYFIPSTAARSIPRPAL